MSEALFAPEGIALIGVSRHPEKVGHIMLKNLIQSGYQGDIICVNPFADHVLGYPCYKTLTSYDGTVDLSVIIVPPDQVKQAVLQSFDAAAKAIIIVTSGFRESGEKGAELEEQIARMCRLKGVRLLGPNCLGLINTANNMNLLYGHHKVDTGAISMVSQSSALCTVFLEKLRQSNLGLAKVVNMGNKCDLSEVDLLRFLSRDSQTQVIIGYLESITNGDDFVKAAEEASSFKPVIILKGATTEAGRRAVSAHSGTSLGTDVAYMAAFMRAGVVRADTIGSLFGYAAAFSLQPLPKGDRTLVITNSGGAGIMAVDAIDRCGLTTAFLQEEQGRHLYKILPEAATLFNPIDLLAEADSSLYETVLKTALKDNGVDAVIIIVVEQVGNNPLKIAEAIVRGQDGSKPVLVSFLGGMKSRRAKQFCMTHGTPKYDSPEHAVDSLRAMNEYVRWKQRPPRIVTRFPVHRRRVERIISRRLRTGRFHLGEIKAKDILHAYDFTIPEGYLALTKEEGVEIADRIGYPVAMKIVSPDIERKSEIDGIRLSISGRYELIDAFDLMTLRVGQHVPKAQIDGIYIEKMIDRGLEVILGMHRDLQFGPMLMFGLGGIFVEVLEDVAFHLAPITFTEAMQMLTGTRSYEMLMRNRGKKGVDIEVIANSLQRVSQLATDFPQIAEIDINPLIIADYGIGPSVANARMTLRSDITAVVD